jgi:hypothetical protein
MGGPGGGRRGSGGRWCKKAAALWLWGFFLGFEPILVNLYSRILGYF